MTAGKLAAAKPAATTNTRVYKCPINKSASTVLEICNQSGSSASCRVALRDYDQVLTLDAGTYNFTKGNVISDYTLQISPGIPTDSFDPGDTITLDNNQGTFKVQDIFKPTATITYPVKVEPIGSVNISSGTQVGTFAVGNTITGATTGLTATIYRVGTSSLHIKIPQITSSSTTVYTNNISGILANDYVATSSGEIVQISSITGYQLTITRAQFGTTAQQILPGSRGDVIRASATTTTINEGATFTNSDTTLTVTSATSLLVGDYLRIDDELLQITGISGTDLTVTRGSLGTTAASHNNGATVTRYTQVQIVSLQFFIFTEEIDNGSGATVDLNVTAGSGSAFSQGNRYVYNLGSGTFEFPIFIPVNADRIVRFTQSDSSNTGHPLRLSLTQDGTWQGGTEYVTGVTKVGTPGSSGAYTQIDLSIENIGTNSSIFTYCANHAQMSENGFLSVDLTPNYDTIYIFDPTKTITTSDTFAINNVNYTITAVNTGAYGYVSAASGTTLKVSLGSGSTAFIATDTFYDSPLEAASDRTLATVSSVTDISAEDYILYGKSISANTTERLTSLVVGPGQSVMVYSSAADLSYVVQGFEDSTADFTPVYYIRQRTSI